MNVLAGGVNVELSGETRVLSPDLNMGAILFDRVGPHWLVWLAERWLGREVKIEGETSETGEAKRVRKLEPVRPEELAMVVHALLQTDRDAAAERGVRRVETEATVRRSITLRNLLQIQTAVASAIVSCFIEPGEGVELDVRADVATPGSAPARTNGTGTVSSPSLQS